MTEYVPTFEDLAGDRATFFQHHFNRAALLRKSALAANARQLLSFQDLDRLLTSEALRPPYIRITKNGERIHENTYTSMIRVQRDHLVDGVVPDKVIAHLRAGATVTWNSMNHYVPAIRAVTSMLADEFGTRSDAVAFLTPAREQGFSIHSDPTDVFVVQLAGKKHWGVWALPDPRPQDGGYYKADDLGEPVIKTTLEPGDVLYIPYGCPHVATAADETSLHLSVTVRPRRWAELICELVEDAVQNDPAFLRYPHLGGDQLAVAAGLREAIGLLQDKLTGSMSQEHVAALVARGTDVEGVRISQPISSYANVDTITSDSLVRIANGTEIGTPDAATEERVAVKVRGSVYKMPRPVAACLNSLSGGRPATVGTLLGAGNEQRAVKAATTLVRIGAIELVG